MTDISVEQMLGNACRECETDLRTLARTFQTTEWANSEVELFTVFFDTLDCMIAWAIKYKTFSDE